MAERPLLIFPSHSQQDRRKRGSRPPPPVVPEHQEQVARLAPRMAQLEAEFRREQAKFQETFSGSFPEDVLVLEVAGPVTELLQAAMRVGLSWLIEQPDDHDAPDAWRSESGKPLPQVLYFVGATQRGMNGLLSLWHRFRRKEDLGFGLTAWRSVFQLLVDVRRYGRRDRLQRTGVLEAWQEELDMGSPTVRTEVELWYRDDDLGVEQFIGEVRIAGGSVRAGPVRVPEAKILQLLVELPSHVAMDILQDQPVAVADLASVRAFRVDAQASGLPTPQAAAGAPPWAERASGAPVIAVFDGVPLANHDALAGAIDVDDPDGLASQVPVEARAHATGVLSVILRGDLSAPGPQPRRPIYTRPVLVSRHAFDTPTSLPDTLFLDTLHGAVARLFEGPAMAPEVAVIHLSLGLRDRVFDGAEASALARLIDHLSWRYGVLFIVSAGNFDARSMVHGLTTDVFEKDAVARHRALLGAVRSSLDERRVLSPAEAINVLTVGALDEDGSGGRLPPGWVPAFRQPTTALYSRNGLGVRRCIKPELVAPGGRMPVKADPGHKTRVFDHPRSPIPVGIQVAAPAPSGSEPTRGVVFQRGTSFAAPQVTRVAALLSDELDALADATGANLFEQASRGLWLKCLLVHTASRRDLFDGTAPAVLGADTRTRGPDHHRLLDRLCGYGRVDEARALRCTRHRVTVIGYGELRQDEAHTYELPLPPSLRGHASFTRSLRTTLAWFSPLNPTSARYRGARLSLEPVEAKGLSLNDSETRSHATERGTVSHRVRHGRGFARYDHGDKLVLEVACSADGVVKLDEPVPYVLAVSLDVESTLPVDIYQEIKAALPVQVRVGVGR